MEKILLINPPLYFSEERPHSIDSAVPPLGLLTLASYINRYSNGFKAEILDVTPENLTIPQIKDRLLSQSYFVIGLTSMTAQLQGTIELAKLIKEEINPNQTMFLGGPHISAHKNFIHCYPELFDYAIAGEAEKTFLDTLYRLVNHQDIPKFQESDIIADLDTIPLPDHSLINRKLYQKSETILFSRGCPFRCYYCSRPAISKNVRYRSVANLLIQIQQCYIACEGYIDFQDDTFTINRKIVLDLCDQILQANLKLQWSCNTRIDLVDDELLAAMKKSGCRQINFGIESGNERVRREIIHKGNFSNQDIYNVFRLCRNRQIGIGAYFMLGHPTETREELQETKAMILSSNIDILGLSIPTPFPGSPLYELAEREGIVNEERIVQFAEKQLGEGYSGTYPVYIPQTLTPEYVYQEMKTINRKFYINWRTFWKHVRQDFSSYERLKKDASDLFSLILRGVSARKPYITRSKSPL